MTYSTFRKIVRLNKWTLSELRCDVRPSPELLDFISKLDYEYEPLVKQYEVELETRGYDVDELRTGKTELDFLPCAHYHKNGKRCPRRAVVWLYDYEGNKNPGGYLCRAHGEAVVREYRDKLGEAWSVKPICEGALRRSLRTASEVGDFLSLGRCPKVGDAVWLLVDRDGRANGDNGSHPVKGVVERVTNIDDKGLSNNYLDVKTDHGRKHLPINLVFPNRPKLVEVVDEYGPVKVWR